MPDNIQKKTTREIFKSNLERTPPPLMSSLILWLHNVRSMHNVGSAFRTADAFGIRSLFLSGYTPYPPRPEIAKTALGAEESVSWIHVRDPDKQLTQIRDEGYVIAGMEQTHQSLLLPDYHPEPGTSLCLLFGNEVTGIEPEWLRQCDQLLEIPQYGKKHSFNISVSIGITLYHFFSSH